MLERESEACLTVLRLSLRAQGNTAHCYKAGRLPMHNSVGHGTPLVAEAATRNPHAVDPHTEPSARAAQARPNCLNNAVAANKPCSRGHMLRHASR